MDNKRNSINVSNLCVSYKTEMVLKKLTFSISSGELVGVIGPNGAGKSTLIKSILGIVPLDNGSITYKQKNIFEHREKFAYVPQRSSVDWDYPVTVWDVVMMGQISKASFFSNFPSSSYSLAESSLERLGIYDLRNRCIKELSGGQQQRVFLARAIAQEAEVLCLDEPLSGVDYATQAIIFKILKELCLENKLILVVHHDLGDIVKYFDRLILLNKSLIAKGTCEEVLRQEILNHAYGKILNV